MQQDVSGILQPEKTGECSSCFGRTAAHFGDANQALEKNARLFVIEMGMVGIINY